MDAKQQQMDKIKSQMQNKSIQQYYRMHIPVQATVHGISLMQECICSSNCPAHTDITQLMCYWSLPTAK